MKFQVILVVLLLRICGCTEEEYYSTDENDATGEDAGENEDSISSREDVDTIYNETVICEDVWLNTCSADCHEDSSIDDLRLYQTDSCCNCCRENRYTVSGYQCGGKKYLESTTNLGITEEILLTEFSIGFWIKTTSAHYSQPILQFLHCKGSTKENILSIFAHDSKIGYELTFRNPVLAGAIKNSSILTNMGIEDYYSIVFSLRFDTSLGDVVMDIELYINGQSETLRIPWQPDNGEPFNFVNEVKKNLDQFSEAGDLAYYPFEATEAFVDYLWTKHKNDNFPEYIDRLEWEFYQPLGLCIFFWLFNYIISMAGAILEDTDKPNTDAFVLCLMGSLHILSDLNVITYLLVSCVDMDGWPLFFIWLFAYFVGFAYLIYWYISAKDVLLRYWFDRSKIFVLFLIIFCSRNSFLIQVINTKFHSWIPCTAIFSAPLSPKVENNLMHTRVHIFFLQDIPVMYVLYTLLLDATGKAYEFILSAIGITLLSTLSSLLAYSMLKPHHEHASEFLEIYMQSRVDLRSYTNKMARLTNVEHVSVYQMEPDYYILNFLVSNKKLKTTDVERALRNNLDEDIRMIQGGIFKSGTTSTFSNPKASDLRLLEDLSEKYSDLKFGNHLPGSDSMGFFVPPTKLEEQLLMNKMLTKLEKNPSVASKDAIEGFALFAMELGFSNVAERAQKLKERAVAKKEAFTPGFYMIAKETTVYKDIDSTEVLTTLSNSESVRVKHAISTENGIMANTSLGWINVETLGERTQGLQDENSNVIQRNIQWDTWLNDMENHNVDAGKKKRKPRTMKAVAKKENEINSLLDRHKNDKDQFSLEEGDLVDLLEFAQAFNLNTLFDRLAKANKPEITEQQSLGWGPMVTLKNELQTDLKVYSNDKLTAITPVDLADFRRYLEQRRGKVWRYLEKKLAKGTTMRLKHLTTIMQNCVVMFCHDKDWEKPDMDDVEYFVAEWLLKVELELNIDTSSNENLTKAIFNSIIDTLPNPELANPDVILPDPEPAIKQKKSSTKHTPRTNLKLDTWKAQKAKNFNYNESISSIQPGSSLYQKSTTSEDV